MRGLGSFASSISAFFAIGLLGGCQAKSKMSEPDCILMIKSVIEMPLKHGIEVQGDYYSVFGRSEEKEVAECLLSQITNTEHVALQKMSPGPHPQFVVGDISVFMLVDMYEIPFTTFLSEEAWNHMGVYEYYRYAQTEGAREVIAAKVEPLVNAKFD